MTASSRTPATVGSKRRKQPLARRLVQPFVAPFREKQGGAALDECEHRQVDCGTCTLEFYLPKPRFGVGPGDPDTVNLDRDESFPESAGEKRTDHAMVCLGASNWNYSRPKFEVTRLLPIPQEPYVTVTAVWQLERVKNGIQLESGNLNQLEQYLRDDYYAFLESEGGDNWEIRKEIQQDLGARGRGWSQEEIDDEIAPQLIAAPASYEVQTFNGTSWLRYCWAPKQQYPRALYYTCLVAPNTLLTVSFNLTEMVGSSLEHWWEPLLADAEALLQGTAVHGAKQLDQTPSPNAG